MSEAALHVIDKKQDDIHSFIKNNTAKLHSRVEKQLASVLFDKSLTISAYLEILLQMRSCYSAMEALLNKFNLTKQLLEERSKLHWLDEDISYLSQLSKKNLNYISKDVDLNAVSNVSQAMGMLYVMEGATLGGGYIFKALNKQTWLNESQGIRFFYNYGDNRNNKWAHYMKQLISFHNNNPDTAQDILFGANIAFETISLSTGDLD